LREVQKFVVLLALVLIATICYSAMTKLESVPTPEPEQIIVEQPTFSESVFEDLRPGQIRIALTDFGFIYIVKPSEAIWAGLEKIAPRTNSSTFDTYDAELDLFVVWGAYDFDGRTCFLQVFPKGYDDAPEQWEGGFYESCRKLYFDYGGRVIDLPRDRTEPNLRQPEYEPAGSGTLRLLEEDAFDFDR